jgi:hypothetical protein
VNFTTIFKHEIIYVVTYNEKIETRTGNRATTTSDIEANVVNNFADDLSE